MGKSFQEQLLKLGLVEKKQVKEAKKEQHQKKKQQTGKKPAAAVDENELLAREAEAKKKARVRELNLEREAKLQKKADDARIRQLVDEHKLAKDDNGMAYRFNFQGTIQRLFVTRETADKLSDGRVGIICLADRFEIIPRSIAEKIRAINGALFIALNTPAGNDPDPDDPYAEYQVPDDLVW